MLPKKLFSLKDKHEAEEMERLAAEVKVKEVKKEVKKK